VIFEDNTLIKPCALYKEWLDKEIAKKDYIYLDEALNSGDGTYKP